MANIPNTEYITVNANGIFVGGKPATTYRGQEIYDIDSVKHVFEWMQAQHPNIAEFHIGAFVTPGEYAKPGNPDGAFGPNAWCRVKYKNGSSSPWVFIYARSSAAVCACNCAGYCALSVRLHASFRSAVFGAANSKQNVNQMAKSKNPEIEKLKTVDFSKLPKTPVELNGYRILVEKISTRTK